MEKQTITERTPVEYPVRYKIQQNMSCFIFIHYLLAKKRKTDSKSSRYFRPALENSRLQLSVTVCVPNRDVWQRIFS